MPPRLRLFLAALLFGPLAAAAADLPQPCTDARPPSPLTLAAAVDFALCHQPQTRLSWASLRSAEAGVDAAQAAYRPGLALSASANRPLGDGAGGSQLGASARLGYTLLDFGQREARRDQARALLDAARSGARSTLAQNWLATVDAYLALATAEGQRDAARRAEEAAAAALAAADARLKVGSGTPLDQLQARSAHAQAVLDQIRLDGQIATAQAGLAVALGIRPTELPPLAPLPQAPLELPIARADVDALLDAAARQRGEVAGAEASLRAAEAGVAAARAAGRPTLAVSASANLSKNSGSPSNHSQGLGLSLDIPFDLDGSIGASRAQAAAQRDSRAAELDRVRQGAQSDAWQAWHGLVTAQQAARAAEVAADSARAAYDNALGRYRAGLGDVLALLNAQSAAARAEQQRVAARYDWLDARARFAWALGGELPADPAGPLQP
ncbi:TolC family protein [Chitinimonas koreensis]|uniref:TolC family protein n=1 Tax=Chitinimonas koreensis TaxID=356302 RepID=UPI00041173CB|nr:TolC family protein [Chitinimonas koreensis]QNM96033.1 TolC family protein [Chitinimonas koreensis]